MKVRTEIPVRNRVKVKVRVQKGQLGKGKVMRNNKEVSEGEGRPCMIQIAD
jgi:hypothetical protein